MERDRLERTPATEYMRGSVWSMALGFMITKPESDDFRVGFSVIPYLVRLSVYTLGVGVMWTGEEAVFAVLSNWRAIVPLSYSIPVK